MPVSSIKVARAFLALAHAEGRTLTPLKLIKLTYLAHGWHLGLEGTELVDEAAEAWPYGPVFPDLYSAVKQYKSSPVSDIPESDAEIPDDDLMPTHNNIIKSVYHSYKKYNGWQLSRITHRPKTPWSETMEKGRGSTISNNALKKHFKTLAEKRNVSW